MNRKLNFIWFLLVICVLFVFLGYHTGVADAEKSFSPARIGVISMRRVFENNKQNLSWQNQMDQKREKMLGELQSMNKQLDADKAHLQTLSRTHEDYTKLKRQIMENTAKLEALQKFYEQDLMTQEKEWTEQHYQQILGVVKKVAESKGLDIILAQEEFRFPAESTSDLLLTIKTSKVMYSSENLDITNEVLEAVDKMK